MAEKSIATRVGERGLAFLERMEKRLDREFALGIGYEKVSGKETFSLIRQAMEGDPQAMAEVEKLAVDNGHQDGEAVPCALCRVIDEEMARRMKKIAGTMPKVDQAEIESTPVPMPEGEGGTPYVQA